MNGFIVGLGDGGSVEMEFYVNHVAAEAGLTGSADYNPFPLLETIVEETAEELLLDVE